jgi:hypothetical protein
MHAFSGTAGTFFSPTFATSLWLFAIKKLLSEILHILTVLYARKICSIEIKFVASVV